MIPKFTLPNDTFTYYKINDPVINKLTAAVVDEYEACYCSKPAYGIEGIMQLINLRSYDPVQPTDQESYNLFPTVLALTNELVSRTGATKVGGISFSRLSPQTSFPRHHDTRPYASGKYTRYHLAVRSAGAVMCWDNDSVLLKPGELILFNYFIPHWVENFTDYERINLMIDLKK